MILTNRIAIIVIALLESIDTGQGQAVNELDQLFNQLGSDRYEIRQNAHDQILEEGKKNKESILNRSLDIYLKATDPEIRYRLRSAMFGIVSGNLRPEGFIGIRMMDSPMRIINGGAVENIRAVQILSVVPNSAASKAGLKPGDRITHLDGKAFKFQSPAYVELSKYIRAKESGENVKLNISRVKPGLNNREKIEVAIKLGSRPEGLDNNRKTRAFTEWFEKSITTRKKNDGQDKDPN
ncbi:MAG: PDZ domain-containing protein [Verrucomicrobiales bacterium]|nr:PDZ domain-containing protein [Verrucomicrobiales bacterium]|tara:strand:- start:341 stop:1054 length:714 start_codon:yes stop_codon:yes gene_type:complete